MNAITCVTGRGLPVRGDDLDTDRIMPARYLRAVTFEGLEQHLFEDDRRADPSHPFNDARYTGATVLVVNRNFGCGSSREHAPQGLARVGIAAIVGESFSEIFLGNSAVLGVPCFSADHASIDALQSLVDRAPETLIEARVDTGASRLGRYARWRRSPQGCAMAFFSGQWNPTAMLLDRFDEIRWLPTPCLRQRLLNLAPARRLLDLFLRDSQKRVRGMRPVRLAADQHDLRRRDRPATGTATIRPLAISVMAQRLAGARRPASTPPHA